MTPPFLVKNDQICIISPSGTIAPEFIEGASELLKSWGFNCTEGLHARNTYGRFAGTKAERIADLQTALDNPNIKAILCSRGGYGLSQIIDSIDFSGFIKHPKWLIGFSDITILHNVISNFGIASIHGIMAKHLTELPGTCEKVEQLKQIMKGNLPEYKIAGHSLNRQGKAEGKLIGGNLSVLASMRGTPFDLTYNGNILFIEDIAEEPYHIDRMIQNLRLGGVLEQVSGLIVGQFSNCNEDSLMKQSIAESILEAVKEYSYPVSFNFPAGHVVDNHTLVLGVKVALEVTDTEMTLKWQ